MKGQHERVDATRSVEGAKPSGPESVARAVFLIALGVLLSVLVSCACGPR